MYVITGTPTEHITFVICPTCNFENYVNQKRGTKVICSNCGSQFYLEGNIFKKGYVPSTRKVKKIVET